MDYTQEELEEIKMYIDKINDEINYITSIQAEIRKDFNYLSKLIDKKPEDNF